MIGFDETSYRVNEAEGYVTIALVSDIPVVGNTRIRLSEDFDGISNPANSALKKITYISAIYCIYD